MTTELVLLTCVLLLTGAGCGPVAEAASLLERPSLLDAVYRPLSSSRPARRSLYGHLLVDRGADDDYSLVKRAGNGAWIWMPAQGYVSVSKNHQASDGDVSGKHGRIMRYGK